MTNQENTKKEPQKRFDWEEANERAFMKHGLKVKRIMSDGTCFAITSNKQSQESMKKKKSNN